MSKHTPGPWDATIGRQDYAAASTIHKASDKEWLIGHIICEAKNEKQRAEDIANARLIAAAPDLLAACKAALHSDDAAFAISLSLESILRDSIAKAEGNAT